MTRDRARKQSIRARMTASGEPYSVAARKLAGDAAPSDVAPLPLLADRLKATLAAPSARIQFRSGTNFGIRGELRAQLLRMGIDAFIKRIARDMGDIGTSGNMAGEGFAEPAADRYQIRVGPMGWVIIGGRVFIGRPGEPVDEHPVPGGVARTGSFTKPLEAIRGATGAEFSGEDVVRGTPCQIIIAEVGSREFTVWVDDAHIRRIRERRVVSSIWGKHRLQETLELWDYGVSTETLDWSRFW